MKYQRHNNTSSLFLLELILAVLFFSVASALCIQIFTKAHLMSQDARDLNFAVNYGDTLIFLRQGKVVRVLNEGEHCTPELVKAVFDVDVHASINPLTGKPFFMPFRGVEKV